MDHITSNLKRLTQAITVFNLVDRKNATVKIVNDTPSIIYTLDKKLNDEELNLAKTRIQNIVGEKNINEFYSEDGGKKMFVSFHHTIDANNNWKLNTLTDWGPMIRLVQV